MELGFTHVDLQLHVNICKQNSSKTECTEASTFQDSECSTLRAWTAHGPFCREERSLKANFPFTEVFFIDEAEAWF